ncbi:hypothetical protein A2cp1_3432 [Anaeromyxobacter dehalogenans 2CP-1]|uniref:Uncharacterized protein n=1 Tax=Anaeromyxobacter dehalogenans (strain ATCC BAA-258 / DSM 21875 / 2CP-1) TaxID=455488 RepID=B8JHQ0_ANAD2|nr:hypothetical protein [Anaeromyxobacter dehalogenans]ACL66762.1 hypothetical protein A2cp1_3432 [Anaeromyxobacter dehalogenans 2CP-1]
MKRCAAREPGIDRCPIGGPATTKTYRIPGAPVGVPYYRAGRMYEPGEIVRLPASELAPGWRVVNGVARPVLPHAWREVRADAGPMLDGHRSRRGIVERGAHESDEDHQEEDSDEG